MNVKYNKEKVSIILPCKNEEQALQKCLDEIKETININHLNAEVIVVNNGSIDSSRVILTNNLQSFPELRIIDQKIDGYGMAYLKGFEEAQGEYIFMADADGTYSFKDIPRFFDEIKKGNDLIIGNRFTSSFSKNSMPFLHRVGNPILSLITRFFFKVKINDIHCGERMITKKALSQIVLYTAGMEFASEMIIKAARQKLKISEIDVSYGKRLGESKLKTFSDGWRHLRFILLYSPFFLFMLPGIILFFIGLISMFFLYFFEIKIFGIQFYIHPMFFSSLLILAGYQIIFFAGFAKIYAITHLGDENKLVSKLFQYITIEKAGLAGILIAIIGVIIYISIFIKWVSSGFGSLNEIKNSIISLTLITIGIETLFSAFMLSIVGIKEK